MDQLLPTLLQVTFDHKTLDGRPSGNALINYVFEHDRLVTVVFFAVSMAAVNENVHRQSVLPQHLFYPYYIPAVVIGAAAAAPQNDVNLFVSRRMDDTGITVLVN